MLMLINLVFALLLVYVAQAKKEDKNAKRIAQERERLAAEQAKIAAAAAATQTQERGQRNSLLSLIDPNNPAMASGSLNVISPFAQAGLDREMEAIGQTYRNLAERSNLAQSKRGFGRMAPGYGSSQRSILGMGRAGQEQEARRGAIERTRGDISEGLGFRARAESEYNPTPKFSAAGADYGGAGDSWDAYRKSGKSFGDYLNMASGVLGMVPGIGTAVSGFKTIRSLAKPKASSGWTQAPGA